MYIYVPQFLDILQLNPVHQSAVALLVLTVFLAHALYINVNEHKMSTRSSLETSTVCGE